ncbi:DNA-3-methyladenine glycosylase I [Candidatus Gracilibacteria bacterium]|nr:DNA-3-methyladenine glycosylase I [Candidatus Gracilibacteria bacterium]
MVTNLIRCPWCGITDQLYVDYHDNEWGVPVHDDRVLFEFLSLEGSQAGLSWITVLRKREEYRYHFQDWNIEKISKMTDEVLEKILLDPGIIRNRLKIYSVRKNAITALRIQQEFGSLDAYFWNFVNHKPIINHPQTMSDFVAKSEISQTISKDLKKRGMSFVGSTIIYAHMQAIGMVDDHIDTCWKSIT